MKIYTLFLLLLIVSAVKVVDYPLESTLEVNIGERFEISLSSNPTTGFRWEATSTPSKVKSDREDPFGKFQASGLRPIGSGGKQIFAFEAQEVGQEVLTFAYKRPWGNNPDHSIATVTVTIKQ